MYNRYIRRDDGTYTKVAEPEPPRQETAGPGPQPPPPPPDGPTESSPRSGGRRRPSAARRALPGTCGGYWISCIWIGWTLGICCCWVCCTFCSGKGGRGAAGGPGPAADFINVKHRT
ncbi:MAG: hypothetical protein ACLSHO_01320 [Dysosmobacter sp.]